MSEYPPGDKDRKKRKGRRGPAMRGDVDGVQDELRKTLAEPQWVKPAQPTKGEDEFRKQQRAEAVKNATDAELVISPPEGPAPKTLEQVFGKHPVPQKVRDAYEKTPEKRKPRFLNNLLKSQLSQEERYEERRKKGEKRERKEEPVTPPEPQPVATPEPALEQSKTVESSESTAAEPAAEAAHTTESEPKGQDVVPVGKVRRFDEKGTEYVDFEDIPKMAADPESAPESVRGAEGTPKEWREKLRGLIEGAKEKVEWWKSSEEHLIRRKEELDAEAEKTGGLEGLFRSMGEKYNKLNWKTKLGVGAGLGVGAVLTGGTLAMVIPLLGIAAQRAAGLSTMYLKFEKDSHQEKWGKEKAFLKAGVYTVLMGIAIKEAIEYASETELAHAAQAKVEGWLGSMLGHEAAPAVVSGASEATPSPAGTGVPTPASEELQKAYDQAKQAVIEGRAGLAEPPGTMPEISVEAVRGKGYEFMMKRLWEQLQERGLTPSDYPEGSDLRRLLETDAREIDKVVHQIAADPEHGFFKPDGTSIQVNLGDKMNIDTDGNIRLNDVIKAPEGAKVTGVYSPERGASVRPSAEVPAQGLGEEARIETVQSPKPIEQPTPAPEVSAPIATASTAPESAVWKSADGQVWRDSSGNPMQSGFPGEQLTPTPEVSAPAEAAPVPPSAETPATPLPTETIPAQEPIPTVDLTQDQTALAEVSGAVTPEAQTFFTRIDNIQINPEAPAIYEAQTPGGETYLAAYGGNDEARFKFIQEYLARPENQGKSIRFAHEVPSIFGSQTRVDEIGASTSEGQTSWLPAFFTKPLSPPSPETFLKKLSN